MHDLRLVTTLSDALHEAQRGVAVLVPSAAVGLLRLHSQDA